MKTFPGMNWKTKSVAVIAMTAMIVCGLALLASEKSGKGFLGVTVENLSPDESGKPGAAKGVVVRSLEEDGPAAKAGIREKDLIQTVNGEKIGSAGSLVEIVRELAPGTEVKISLLREGKPVEVTARLGEARDPEFFSGKFFGNWAPRSRMFSGRGRYLGITLQELTADLAPYFGVKAGEGVLILAVEKESPAEKAEVKAGDVIVEIGGKPAKEPAAVSKAVRETKKGDKISLAVLRHGKKLILTAEPCESRCPRRIKRVIRVVPGCGKNREFMSETDAAIPDMEDLDIDLPEIDIEVPDVKLVREQAKEAMEKSRVEMEKVRAEMEKNKEKLHRQLREIREGHTHWI